MPCTAIVDWRTARYNVKKKARYRLVWQCPACKRTFKKQNQHHYCGRMESVDSYIEAQDEAIRPLLQQVRAVIREAAPDASETMAWQMPTYRQKENVIHFAAASKHIGIYPGEEAVRVFSDRLTGYQVSKGTIRLPLDRPLDLTLIKDITEWRIRVLEAKHAASQSTQNHTDNGGD